VKEFF